MGPLCLIFILAFFGSRETSGLAIEKVDNVNITSDEGDILSMKLGDAVKFLQLSEIHKLEKTLEELQDEKKDLVFNHDQQVEAIKKEMGDIEKKYEDKLKSAERLTTNQEVLINFIKNFLYYNDKKATTCLETVQTQADKLKILGEERKSYQKKNEMNLKQAYLQVDIIKSQEKEKEILKQTLKTQRELYEDYANLTNFDLVTNMENFPTFAQFLTKTLADQNEKIIEMRTYFEEEQQVKENMEQILEELQGLNITFISDTAKWDLLDQYQDIIKIQDANLKSLAPTISYVVENNKRFQYSTAEDGTLLGMTPCQCLPDTGESNITVSAIEITCPGNTVSAETLLAVNSMACPDGLCPEEVQEEMCGDYYELPWEPWTNCTGPDCLVSSLRKKLVRDSEGNVAYQFEGEGAKPIIVTSGKNLDLFIPAGASLGVFAMGGGGGADDSYSGSSGFFSYEVLPVEASGTYNVNVTIGRGGDYADGTPTEVLIKNVGTVTARGGGKARGAGWSGGSSEKGGWNGGSGDSQSNGSGEPLPTVCGEGVTLTAGPTGRYDSDGTGGGGVIVNGQKPSQVYYRDGEGYGAGGGEDNYDGYDGIAVLMLCY